MFFALQCASALVRMPVRLPRICRKAGTEDSWKDMMLSFVVVMISVTHHCERSEAIRLSLCRRMDCFASLAMTVVVRGYSLSHRRRACGRRLPQARRRCDREYPRTTTVIASEAKQSMRRHKESRIASLR